MAMCNVRVTSAGSELSTTLGIPLGDVDPIMEAKEGETEVRRPELIF